MTWVGFVAIVGLGAFHGLNPGMGWLFAVSIGLQERSQRALGRALVAIAAGHAASVLVVAGLVVVLRSVVATQVVAIAGGLGLVGFGLYRALCRRHFRWAGMRLTSWQLAGWSFLMSTVHGAGLMLLPVLVADSTLAGSAHRHTLSAAGVAPSVLLWQSTVAVIAHVVATTVVAGAIAVVVYRVVGLAILRSAWVNVDRIWAIALIGSGVATVALAV